MTTEGGLEVSGAVQMNRNQKYNVQGPGQSDQPSGR